MEKHLTTSGVLALLLLGLSSWQGAGADSDYDWMGTPIITGSVQHTRLPDYLSPYTAGRPEWDPYGFTGTGGYGALNLQIEPADPAREGLEIRGENRFSNLLYLQKGKELLVQGSVLLGEQIVLWARVAGKGSLILYDYNQVILNQGYVTPGWYRITGAYADYLGGHQYRFTVGNVPSSNLSVMVNPGGYPTSLSLTGIVVDQNGQGLPGARVIISNSEGGRFTTTSGASGYYALDVATGAYLVSAELPGYVFTPTSVRAWAGMVSAARPVVGRPVASYAETPGLAS